MYIWVYIHVSMQIHVCYMYSAFMQGLKNNLMCSEATCKYLIEKLDQTEAEVHVYTCIYVYKSDIHVHVHLNVYGFLGCKVFVSH